MAVGRRDPAHDRDAAHRRGRASARSSRGWHDHGLAGIGRGHGLRPRHRPRGDGEEADARGLRDLRGALRAAVHRDHGAGVRATSSTSSTSSCAGRSAAQERLQRIVLSERGLPASPGALAASLGGAVVVLDGPRRGSSRRHEFRRRALRASSWRSSGATPAAIASSDPELAARTLVLDIAPTGQGVAGGAAPGLARQREGLRRAHRRRPAAAPAGRDRGRVRAPAPAGRRHDRPAARRRRARRARARRPRGVRAAAAPGAVRPRGRGGGARAARRRVARGGGAPRARAGERAACRDAVRARRGPRGPRLRAAARRARRRAVRPRGARPRARRAATPGDGCAARGRRSRRPGRACARDVPRGALRPGGPLRRARRRDLERRRRPPAHHLPRPRIRSRCCSRCRTPTRCACSASRCSARSRPTRATTAASSLRSLEAFIECNGAVGGRGAAGCSATATRCATGCARWRS